MARATEGMGTSPDESEISGFPARQSTRRLRDMAAYLLRGVASQPDWHAAVAMYREKAREWHIEHRRLLL